MVSIVHSSCPTTCSRNPDFLIVVPPELHCRFMDPLTTGDYPYSMQSLVGNRLPKFTDEQSKMLNGSFDFLGLNYYSASYAAHVPDHPSNRVNVTYTTDSQVSLTSKARYRSNPLYFIRWICNVSHLNWICSFTLADRNGVAIGEKVWCENLVNFFFFFPLNFC